MQTCLQEASPQPLSSAFPRAAGLCPAHSLLSHRLGALRDLEGQQFWSPSPGSRLTDSPSKFQCQPPCTAP